MSSGGIFDLSQLKEKIAALQERTSLPGFWEDQSQAQITLKKISRLEKEQRIWEDLITLHDEADIYLELLQEEGGLPPGDEALTALSQYEASLDAAELRHLLSDPDDEKDRS